MENDANTGWFERAPGLERARELFAESGYDGRPVTVLHATNIDFMNNSAQIIVQWLREIGVNAELATSDWGGVVMRLMDGLVAIPAILLAIALVALTSASVFVVIVAITIPELPRVVRLVRSVALGVREAPYVEAAVFGGTRTLKIIIRHILPNTVAPLIVQSTNICASAILVESPLSFLGAVTPPDVPTWGNMIARSRLYPGPAPWTMFFPGIALAVIVLAVNLLGDGLRGRIDPCLARRM